MSSTSNIAIITAYNPQNSGMYSVDLAAISFFSELNINHTFFLSQSRKGRISKYLPFLNPYELKFGSLQHQLLISSKQLMGFSHIVYWGDFLNNPRYGTSDFASRDVGLGHSNANIDAFHRWEDIFLLKNFSSDARILAIGGNFQHLFDESEKDLLKSFLAKAHLVLPRDPHSYNNLKSLASSPSNLLQGMDCAFLLPKLNINSNEADYFCYEFGRSSLLETCHLIKSIEAATGLKGIPLAKWLRLKSRGADKVFKQQRRLLAMAQFVVTDIYHLSINSMNCGVPVYCLGQRASEQSGTLGDFKKRQLLSMVGLDNFYYEVGADYISDYDRIARSVAHLKVRKSKEWQEHLKKIDQLKDEFRSNIVSALLN